jgi:hypothetical protein
LKSNLLVQSLLVVECCFCHGKTAFNFPVHLASTAIMPPKQLKYSTQSYLNIKLYFVTRFLLLNSRFSQSWRLWVRTACSLGRH